MRFKRNLFMRGMKPFHRLDAHAAYDAALCHG
jgi:hypothetical protein